MHATFAQMSLEQKVGQMIMAGVPGTVAGSEAAQLIGEYNIGGIILFAENVESPGQVAELTARLQRMAKEAGHAWPLLVSVDQEGGPVARIRDGVTPLPSQMALGAAGSTDMVRQVAALSGAELAAMGIYMNMAPAVDVNNNPANPVIGVRSFGEDPERVAAMGAAYIEGLQGQGVLAVAKHFPGHGDTDVDSHLALPTVLHSRERLDRVELVPFRRAIEAGVTGIMSAHITFPEVDPMPGLPSTLSKAVLTGILRDELGFTGLIITDALEMRGISAQFGLAEAAVMAIEAGADIALIAQSHYNDEAKQAVEALAAAVKAGRIPMERIEASLARIGAAKQKLPREGDLPGAGLARRDKTVFAAPASIGTVQEAAQRAITIVRNEGARLPLDGAGLGAVLVVGPDRIAGTMAAAMSSRLGRTVPALSVAPEPTEEVMEQIVTAARQVDTVVALTYRSLPGSARAELVHRLHRVHPDMVVVGADAPYELELFPDIPVYVAAYATDVVSLGVAADVLLGNIAARGRLPVTIPGLYEAGHGL